MAAEHTTGTLSVLVPTVSAAPLGPKLADLAGLAAWTSEVVVCFNGPESELPAVRELVEREDGVYAVLSVSPPFNKARALRDGLRLATSARILYSDVDCLLHRGPRDLEEVLESDDVCSFLVLRAPARSESEVELKLARRRLLGRFWDSLGLVYLSARGGGYVAGNLADVIDERVLSDDLVFPAQYALARGRRIVPSEALVFYEAHAPDGRRYDDKLPRLIYGSFQAARVAQSPRLRASLALQKLAKYVAVAAVPPLVVVLVARRRLPPWLALALLLRARLFARTWEGVVRGAGGRPPRW